MYRAKDSGKDMAVHYDQQLQVQVVRRLDIEHGLRVAVAGTGLALAYQPILPLGDSGAAITLEALARWQTPTDQTGPPTPTGLDAPAETEHGPRDNQLGPLEQVGPDEFIGVAEDTGLIVPLGRQTLARACRDAARWRAEHGLPAQVAVNLSARELAQADLVDAVDAVLTTTGLPAAALQLEITESVLMADVQRSSRVLHALRELGVSIAVDDFGTGYSSLAYLRDFPIDVLKIDRSFVSRLPDDPGLVSVVLALARTIGVSCVAEGVETNAQLDALRQLGCERVQGFLLSRPLPADQVSAYLAEHATLARTAR
jgi:EAL domain-containing protein (putative c-di-GMP-specific phosphodiesterase class I)